MIRSVAARRSGAAGSLLASFLLSACGGDASNAQPELSVPVSTAGTVATQTAVTPSAAGTTAGVGTAPVASAGVGAVQPSAAGTAALTAGAAAPTTAAQAGAPAAGTGHTGHGDPAAAGVGGTPMTDAMHQCSQHVQPVDPRDAMLTSEPLIMNVGLSQDTLMPQLVLDWMDENQFAEAHDGWHLVRKWDQTCRKSNATTCTAAQKLEKQGLKRASIQQGAPGDGVAFMMMHRHMIAMLNQAFPKNAKLFTGFASIPKSRSDAENPQPWREISWTSDNLKGFDILEHIEEHLDQFKTEDDLGQYIENTYRWTAQSPMSPLNSPGSGLHGALHAQWSVSGSPANLIQQAVDVKNYAFWKLHGWIDTVWERYRKAKGLTNDDPAYAKLLEEQCMEMIALEPRNRTGMQPDTGTTNPGTTAPETGVFAQQIRPIFDSTCGGCHSPIAPTAGMTLGGTGISSADIIDGLVGMKASNGEYNLVEPGAPQKSWLYLKASGDAATAMCTSACDREPMPPNGMGLNATQLSALSQWIMSGATKQ